MSLPSNSRNYYFDAIHLYDLQSLEARFQSLLLRPIESVSELEAWLTDERKFLDEIKEAMTGHQIEFLRDISNTDKRNRFLYDQNMVQPILSKYQAKLDKKFCDCPFTNQLNKSRYGLMKKVRSTNLKLFREENISLTIREQQLIAKYREMMGELYIQWDGETKPSSYVKAQIDHPNREIRERAWKLLAQAYHQIKPEIDQIMDELVSLRHQMAIHAGFKNYRDYLFVLKHREYRIQDCYDLHTTVEKYVVPVAGRLNKLFQNQLGVESYHPWDHGPCTLHGTPFSTVTELMDGFEQMLN